MILYFDSPTFGQLQVPQYDYDKFAIGNGGYPGPLDGSMFGTGSYIRPFDVLRGRAGAYAVILSGVGDGLGGTFDWGIMDAGDGDNWKLVRWFDPDDRTTYTDDGTFQYQRTIYDQTYVTTLHFGSLFYNNNTSNPAQLAWCISPGVNHHWKIDLATMQWSEDNTSPSMAFDTPGGLPDPTLALAAGIKELPYWSYDNGSYGNNYLNTDISLANGGAAGYVPADYEGGDASAEVGNGDWGRFGYDIGAGDGYSDGVLTCGLVAIYHPTSGELTQLAQYLTSPTFEGMINAMWSDPMQSIIGLFTLPTAPDPSTVQSDYIHLGGVNTGVSADKLVTGHTRVLSWGKIDLVEYFRGLNFLDYEGTEISIYLPYIGFRRLQTDQVMGTELSLTYVVDFLNGDFIAQLVAMKKGEITQSRNILNERGNMAINIPLTSQNYTGTLQGLLNAGTSIIGGNVIGGISSAISGNKMQTERSGSVGGSAAAMGVKFPYLIIDRKKPAQPANYSSAYGRPTSLYKLIGEIEGSGLIVADMYDTRLDYASAEEKDEIIRLFAEGVRV